MKNLLVIICVLAFGLNANAQMRRASVDTSKAEEYNTRINIPATGTSDADKPEVKYTDSLDKILTIGEIKKISEDHVVSLGYDRPSIVHVYRYVYVLEYSGRKRRNWNFVIQEPSSHYSDKDCISFWRLTQIFKNGVWKNQPLKKLGPTKYIPRGTDYHKNR